MKVGMKGIQADTSIKASRAFQVREEVQVSSECRGRGFSRPTVFLTVGPLRLLLPSGLKKKKIGQTALLCLFSDFISIIHGFIGMYGGPRV